MNNKKFELNTLPEIFDKGNRYFVIPNYQRGYSWGKEQWSDLTTDIGYVISGKKRYTHYTGTLVAASIEGEDNVFEVVDGQQRLTSFTLLLAALRHHLQSPNRSFEEADKISENISKWFLFKEISIGTTKRIFEIGKDQDGLYEELIKNGRSDNTLPDTKSDTNLIEAYSYFHQWLEDHELIDVYEVVTKYFGFLFYAPKKTSEIGIMFEVINNRGKDLSELEKLKNYLIYFSDKNQTKDLKNYVEHKWGNILRNLNIIEYTSNDEENSFLRNCWIVSEDTNKSKSYYVYDELKEKYPPDNRNHYEHLQRFISFISNASKTYKRLFVRNFESNLVQSKEEFKHLKRISYHSSTASVIPLILAIYEKLANDQESRIRLLELIEKLNFRYYVTGIANRSDSGQGTLFNIAHKFYNNFGSMDDDGKVIDSEWMYNKLVRFIAQRANDSSFIQHLTLDKDEAGDYYRWGGLNFFLASYEEQLRFQKKERDWVLDHLLKQREKAAYNSFFQREHIWASNDYTVIVDDDIKHVNKRRLGNFVLLKEGQNKGEGKRPVQEKVVNYKDLGPESDTYMLPEIKDIYDKSVEFVENELGRKNKISNYWLDVYQKMFDLREEKLVSFALERWEVEELNEKVDPEKLVIDSFTEWNEVYHTPKLIEQRKKEKA